MFKNDYVIYTSTGWVLGIRAMNVEEAMAIAVKKFSDIKIIDIKKI